MAQVDVENVVEHLRTEMRRALEAALREVSPENNVDSYALFRAFRRAVRRKCSSWESVPDRCIRMP